MIATLTVKNVDIADYDEFVYEAAPAEGAIITINYTNDTSGLVDSMIVTKSDTSNVIKGSLVE